MRFCVVKRQRLPRTQLFRVVRVRTADGRNEVRIAEGNGRSAYVSRDVESVVESKRKNRLGRALRCKVKAEIYDELVRMAEEYMDTSDDHVYSDGGVG